MNSHRFVATGRRSLSVLLPVLLFVFTSAVQATAAPEAGKKTDESWQVIYIDDVRIGYGHTLRQPVERNGRKIIRSLEENHMEFERFGQTLKLSTRSEFDETPEGKVLSFTHVTQNPPARETRITGRVEGDRLEIETTTAGVVRRKSLPWDPETRAPMYQNLVLSRPPLKPRDIRRFRIFLPELKQATGVRVAADQYQMVETHDGESHKLLRVKITQSILPTMTTRAWLDEQGKALRTESDLLGMKLIVYEVPERIALEKIAGGELDLAVNTLVSVKPLREGHDSRRVVYRITTPDADPAESIIAGDTQQVKSLGPHEVELTVRSLAIPKRVRLQNSKPEYLADSEYLQTGDRRVVEHARRAAAGERDPGEIARRMEKYVHEKLSRKNFSTAMASAAEVAERLEGDCTEHAVLLAAMLRVEKIPSRIAVGLVYIPGRNAFGGHMWTEARLGERWIPLDATLAKGGIGAGHIKLGESSLADDGPSPLGAFAPLLKLLGNMKIEVIESD